MYRSILIPTDGTEITAEAVDSAIALAKALGARLSTITVKEPFPYSAISEMQPIPPQEFYDAQERIALTRQGGGRGGRRRASIARPSRSKRSIHGKRSWITRRRRSAISSSWPRTAGAASARC